MKLEKFSKSYKNILKIKEDFYVNNYENLKYVEKVNKVYKSQKKRTHCKNCEKKISSFFLKSFSIPYSICKYCGHLNGMYEDTDKFVSWLYSSGSGENYELFYKKYFKDRVKKIYLPKVEFLKKVIKKKINLIDIGSGSGGFLKALEQKKISAIGLEPNKNLTIIGNKYLKRNKLKYCNIEDTYKLKNVSHKINVLSLIGVLEHLNKPNLLIKNFIKSKIEYLYISVPIYSLSVFIENSFKSVFPRMLSNGHTHLYTKESLNYLAKKNHLKILGEWWFGTDIADLYRSLIITSSYTNKNIYINELNKKLYSVIDELQNVLDKNKICSEVHIIFKKKK